MYLGNDLPLIVKYDVASLGEIRLCLAPLPRPNSVILIFTYSNYYESYMDRLPEDVINYTMVLWIIKESDPDT